MRARNITPMRDCWLGVLLNTEVDDKSLRMAFWKGHSKRVRMQDAMEDVYISLLIYLNKLLK